VPEPLQWSIDADHDPTQNYGSLFKVSNEQRRSAITRVGGFEAECAVWRSPLESPCRHFPHVAPDLRHHYNVAGAQRQTGGFPIDQDQKISGTGEAISRNTANFVGRLMLRRIARVCWHPGELRILDVGSGLDPDSGADRSC
jgi:hypothetical protein